MALPGLGGSGFGGRAVASAKVNIRPDLTGFRQQLSGGLGKAFKNLAPAAATAGVIGLAAATIGAAVAGAKLAADFETSLAKIQGLVGVSTEKVAEFEKAILKLGPAVGKGPQELADALFFITSAGIRGSEALDILEQSAKASTAGLGDLNAVTDAVTSAINAYGIENLSAAEAVNVLVGSVREGKLDAESLARVLGRVIPIASELGIEFNEVGAAIAAMSRTGLKAEEAVVALRGILNSLLKPTSETNKLFLEAGQSLQGLRDTIRNEGLFEGLLILKDVIGDNEEAFAAAIPNVRALAGFLNLMGENAEENRLIFQSLASDTDFLGEAFGAIAGTDAFAFTQAMAEIKTILTEIGGDTLPAFAQILTSLAPIIRDQVVPAFKFLTGGFADFVSGIGQIISAFGGLPGIIQTTIFGLVALGTALTFISAHPVIAVLIGLGAAIAIVGANARDNAAKVDELSAAIIRARDAAEDTPDAFAALAEIGKELVESGLIEELNNAEIAADDLVAALQRGRPGLREFFSDLKSGEGVTSEQRDKFIRLERQLFTLARNYEKASEAAADLEAEQTPLGVSTKELTLETLRYLSAAGILVPVFDEQAREFRLVTQEEKFLIEARQADTAAALAETDAVADLTAEEEANAAAAEEVASSTAGYADALGRATGATASLTSPTEILNRAQLGLVAAFQASERALEAFGPESEEYQEALEDLIKADGNLEKATQGVTKQLEAQRQAILDVGTAAAEAASPVLSFFRAQRDLTESQEDYNEAVGAFGKTSDEAIEAFFDLAESQGGFEAAQAEFILNIEESAGAIEGLGISAGALPETIEAALLEVAGVPLANAQALELAFREAGLLIKAGLFSPFESIREEATAILQEQLAGIDFSNLSIPGFDLSVPINVTPDVTFLGGVNIPQGFGGGVGSFDRLVEQNNFFQFGDVNGAAGGEVAETIEETTLDPAIQRAIARLTPN